MANATQMRLAFNKKKWRAMDQHNQCTYHTHTQYSYLQLYARDVRYAILYLHMMANALSILVLVLVFIAIVMCISQHRRSLVLSQSSTSHIWEYFNVWNWVIRFIMYICRLALLFSTQSIKKNLPIELKWIAYHFVIITLLKIKIKTRLFENAWLFWLLQCWCDGAHVLPVYLANNTV